MSNAERVTLVLEGFAEPSLRLAMARSLDVYAGSALARNQPTAASILRQAAAITGQGGGVLELECVTRANLGEVLDVLGHSMEARKTELAAVLVEHRPALDAWVSAIFGLWSRLMSAAAAMPTGSIPPMGGDPS